nr:hypothetical protein [uncultured Ottowia sp.]
MQPSERAFFRSFIHSAISREYGEDGPFHGLESALVIKAGFAVSTAAARAGWPRAGFRKGADCRRGGECLSHNLPHAHA